MAVKPWLGAIKEPTGFKAMPGHDKPPAVQLEVEYVHGYRVKDCRNNLRYVTNNKIVYNAAGLGIVMDIDTNTQQFFGKHIDDVTAIAYHPETGVVATGELGPKPTVYVWNAETTETIATLKGGVIKGIVSLAFSPSGQKLVATSIDDNHMVAVFNVRSGALESCEKGDTALIVATAFKSESEFVTVGPKHFKLWTLAGKLAAKKGQFGNANNMLNCVAFNKNDCLVGAANGELQVWQGISMGKALPLHKGALDAIWVDAK
jgi:microtubule-associated protein-like 6